MVSAPSPQAVLSLRELGEINMSWIRETLTLAGYKEAINGYREDLYNMAYKCGELNDENADLRAEIEALKAENAELKEVNETQLSTLSIFRKNIVKKNKTIENYEGIIASLKEKLGINEEQPSGGMKP